MDEWQLGYAQRHLAESREAIARCAEDKEFVAALGKISDQISYALKQEHKILLCGNGGSASDAQHIAAEFLSRFESERTPLAALALTANSSVITAIGNDFGFESVFERQVRGLGIAGDVLIAISTSGRSKNVLRALDAARERGLFVIGFTGNDGGEMRSRCDLLLCAPSNRTAVIQQIHLTAAHIICGLVERRLGGSA
jgi:D-sedoheptulose 7-phosphate isomerase